MLPQEIIRRKRDGHALNTAEIAQFVQGLTDGGWSEGQVAALAMAVFLRGMGRDECVALTHAMVHSGRVMAWPDLPGPVLDKHSSGGVGDKVSLMLAPMVAACGGYVPMISGRGLGHTGGTLDKLAAIPVYNATPNTAHLDRVVREVGCAIIGQTADLAPADGRLYAIRDVTATVESVPLITASILSKKLAAGLHALVMDVKCGNGAFADSRAMADELAHSIVAVANGAGLKATALITDMNQVLGHTVGNALEMREAMTRRFSDKNIKAWGKPDMLLIDGGKGQLEAALSVLREKDLQIPAIGLAKKHEEIVVRNDWPATTLNPKTVLKLRSFSRVSEDFTLVDIPNNSNIVKLLQRIRDESHRFAVSYHTVLKRNQQTKNALEEIPGIGPKTRQKLIKALGSVKAIQHASEEEIAAIIGRPKAKYIKKQL